jgi:hypothetical protein
MPCQHYKDALIEAVASGAPPQGDLRMHLDACAFCRAAFAQEQALFSSIDAGLHVTSTAEVPASLLPRVRARLDEESAPRRIWATNWLVVASATVMVVAFFAARIIWRPDVRQNLPANSVRTNPSTPVFTTPREHTQTPEPSAKNNPHPQILLPNNSQKPGSQSARSSIPEVLVPRDQEVLLAEYAEQWQLHKRAPLLAQDADTTILSPLQVAPIQIAELDVKLLVEEKSQ